MGEELPQSHRRMTGMWRSLLFIVVAAALPQSLPSQEIRVVPGERRVVSVEAAVRLTLDAPASSLIVCTVQQVSVDVRARLHSGPTLVDERNATKANGASENVETITAEAVALALELQPARPGLSGEVAVGCAVRAPNDADRSRVAGRVAMREADALAEKGTSESLRAALEAYERARALFDTAGELQLQGVALDNIGYMHDQLGDRTAALDAYNKALAFRRESGDRAGEALTLQGIGVVNIYLGNYDEALSRSEAVLTLAREMGDRSREAGTLHNIGGIYWSTDEMQKALNHYERALAIWRETGEQPQLASTLNNIGDVYRRLGEYDKALRHFEQALTIRRKAGNKRAEAHSLHTLGLTYLARNEAQKALDNFTRALALRQETGDKRGEAYSTGGSALAHFKLGNTDKAISLQRKALELWATLNEPRATAETRQNLAESLVAAGMRSEARRLYEEAIPVASSLRDRTTEANAYLGLAIIERAEGRLDLAQTNVEKAIGIVDDLRGRLANLELRTAYFSSVRRFYDFYIDLLMERHRSASASGFDAAALQASEAARGRSLLDTLAAGGVDLTRRGTAQLFAQQSEALRRVQMLQKKVARLAEGRSTEAEMTAAKRALNEAEDAHDRILAALRESDAGYASLIAARPASLSELQASLGSDTMLLEYHLGDEKSYVWAVTASGVRSWELPPRRDIEAVALRLYEALDARNRDVRAESPDKRGARLSSADESIARAAVSLTRLILPDTLRITTPRVAISPDGALQYLPLGLLRRNADSRSLVEQREIVSLPAASMAVRRSTSRRSASSSIAVFADPVFEGDDPRLRRAGVVRPAGGDEEVRRAASDAGLAALPRLRFSRNEAEAIAAEVGEGVMRALDFRAARELAESDAMRRYRTLHFATHGIINSRNPERSGLVFSLFDEQGRHRDGFLRLRQIYSLDIDAELVVLSACQTALGKDVRGEGLVGVTRGFMYAGAPRVIASFWRVDDRATSKLMAEFYQRLSQGATPAAALRQAQLILMKEPRWASPYYWAAFQLHGDWR